MLKVVLIQDYFFNKIMKILSILLCMLSCASFYLVNEILSFKFEQLEVIAMAEDLTPFYSFKGKTLEGKDFNFSELKNKVVLLVNTASKCGYTPQYKGLEELYQHYKNSDFEVIGFPSNDFGSQEPGSNAEIAEFCKLNFGVTFTMLEKAPVTGEEMQPVYKFLTAEYSKKEKLNNFSIKWNFEKFLVDKSGNVVNHFDSKFSPSNPELIEAIEKLLK
jgi:glutathione peroxidase